MYKGVHRIEEHKFLSEVCLFCVKGWDVNEKKDRFAVRIIYAVGDTFVAYTTRFVNSRTQNVGDIGVLCRNLDV